MCAVSWSHATSWFSLAVIQEDMARRCTWQHKRFANSRHKSVVCIIPTPHNQVCEKIACWYCQRPKCCAGHKVYRVADTALLPLGLSMQRLDNAAAESLAEKRWGGQGSAEENGGSGVSRMMCVFRVSEDHRSGPRDLGFQTLQSRTCLCASWTQVSPKCTAHCLEMRCS